MEATLWASIERLAPLSPNFVSVTYGAGGSTRERTHRTVARLVRETRAQARRAPDLRRRHADEVDEVVRAYWDAGVRHIVALRGDPPRGVGARLRAASRRLCAEPATWSRASSGIGDFEVSVSAYPGEAPGSGLARRRHRRAEAQGRRRRDPGDHPVLLRQRPLLPLPRPRPRARASTIPIVPGILPVQNFKQAANFAATHRRQRAGLAGGPLRRARRGRRRRAS